MVSISPRFSPEASSSLAFVIGQLPLSSLHILRAGRGWAVLLKPAGISVHATQDPDEVNLLDLFHDHLRSDSEWSKEHQWNGSAEPSVVHRLDRPVSGAVLVVFDKRILKTVHQQFENKDIHKVYHAWVYGAPKEQQGLWKMRLTKKAEGRQKPAGFPKFQVPAQTEYRVLEQDEQHSLLELTLITGRKHQLRRHCALSKCPIVGDERYGKKDEAPELQQRIQLHAYSLSFLEPWDQKEHIQVIAPEPDDFRAQ